jgi:hypothetical protein
MVGPDFAVRTSLLDFVVNRSSVTRKPLPLITKVNVREFPAPPGIVVKRKVIPANLKK